jgi:hypothetical protein
MAPAAFAQQAQPAPNRDPSAIAPGPESAQTEPPLTSSENPAAVQQEIGTRLAALVPSGMSIQDACTGFTSLAECSTALHVAQNLNVPFADLKGKVTAGDSIGGAIHSLKPGVNARAEALKAEKQARDDLLAPQG